MELSAAKQELPGEIALCTEYETIYIGPDASSRTERYVSVLMEMNKE